MDRADAASRAGAGRRARPRAVSDLRRRRGHPRARTAGSCASPTRRSGSRATCWKDVGTRPGRDGGAREDRRPRRALGHARRRSDRSADGRRLARRALHDARGPAVLARPDQRDHQRRGQRDLAAALALLRQVRRPHRHARGDDGRRAGEPHPRRLAGARDRPRREARRRPPLLSGECDRAGRRGRARRSRPRRAARPAA